MAPGPKKKSFLTPRNNRNNQKNQPKDEEKSKLTDESFKNVDKGLVDCNLSDDIPDKKYSKRSIGNNWTKYEESPNDPHSDYTRGKDIEIMLSYSNGSGSQLKLQEEKDWESDSLNYKDIPLNLQDLANSMKCIPFHERINVQNYFTNKHIDNFLSAAETWKKSLKSEPEPQVLQSKAINNSVGLSLAIIEEPDLTDSNEVPFVSNYVVQDKTVDIINSLASNLTFKEFSDKEKSLPMKNSSAVEKDTSSEAANNDLDFLLTLNISSKVAEKTNESTRASNVDDWLNSILDE